MRRILISLLLLSLSSFAATRNVKTDCSAVGNGVANDTAAINSCIALLMSGDTLLFPAGTYKVTGTLTINVPNVTVDLSSNTATISFQSSSAGFLFGACGSISCSLAAGVALSGTASTLTNSFTTVSSLGVSAGDYVALEQAGADDSNGHSDNYHCDVSGCRGEVLKVQSVNGNTITVTTALHDTYIPTTSGTISAGSSSGGATCSNTSNGGQCATAYKVNSPLTGITIQNGTLDGTNISNVLIYLNGVANPTLSNLTLVNGGAASYTVLASVSYGLTMNSVTVTSGTVQNFSLGIYQYGNVSMNGVTLSGSRGSSGFMSSGANSTILGLSIDGAGMTSGSRLFKLTATKYSVFNNLTVTNGQSNFNGMSAEYYSAHNAFVNCSVTNNPGSNGGGGAGVNSFGNYNQYNTYSNCTISGNGNVGLYVSNSDALGQANDSFTTVNGGTLTGLTGVSNAVLLIFGASPYVTGALFNGPAPDGITMGSPTANGCINSNTFNSSLTAAISSNSSSNVGTGNTLNGKSSNLQAGSCTPGVPTFSPSPSSLSFGSVAVGTPSSLPITVTNNGTGGYNLTSYLYIAGANPGDFTETDNCHAVLAANTCNITVTFTPSTTGARSATVSTYDNTLNATNSITLTGNGGSVVVNPPAPSPGFMLSDLVPGSLR